MLTAAEAWMPKSNRAWGISRAGLALRASWRSGVLSAAKELGSCCACRLLSGVRFRLAAGANANPGARRGLQHQPTTTCPARIAASDRRASTAGAGELAADGQLRWAGGRHASRCHGTEPRDREKRRAQHLFDLLSKQPQPPDDPADLHAAGEPRRRPARRSTTYKRTRAQTLAVETWYSKLLPKPISTSCAIRLSCRSIVITWRCCGNSSRRPRIDFGSAK